MRRWADLSRSSHGVSNFLNRSHHGLGRNNNNSNHNTKTTNHSAHGGGGTSGGGTSANESYAQRVLMEECAMLRKRIKELEEETHSGKTSIDSTDSEESMNHHHHQNETAQLRKELIKVESEKASMELDFMNQISQMARDNAERMEQQQLMTRKEGGMLSPVKEGSARVVDDESEKDAQIKQLKQDLCSADKELEVIRKDIDALHSKNGKLEAQKAALIEENTAIRLEVDNESKVITSLNDVMAENEQHFKSRIEKLETEIALKNGIITKKDQEMADISSTLIKHEGEKAMLLEEITDLRLQLDRNDQSKQQMKKKLDGLELATKDESESQRVGSLKQAASDAEEKAEEMQEQVEKLENELRSIQKSHKAELTKVEETVCAKELEVEQARKKLAEKELEVRALKVDQQQLNAETISLRRTLEETKKQMAEMEQEVATLNSQRIFYEKRSTQCIMEHVTEADEAKDKVYQLEKKVKELEKQIAAAEKISSTRPLQVAAAAATTTATTTTTTTVVEKETFYRSGQLKKPSLVLKKTFPPTFPPPLPQLSPQLGNVSRSQPSSPSWAVKRNLKSITSAPSSPSSKSKSVPQKGGGAPPSPSPRSNVRALAACFEGKSANLIPMPDHDNTTASATTNSSPQIHYAQEIDSLQNQVATLENYLEDARHENETLQQTVKRQSDQLDSSLEDAKHQNEMLQQKLKKQSDQIGELLAEVAALNATKTAVQNIARKAFEKESLEYKEKIEQLEQELADTRSKLQQESTELEKLKSEIREITIDRLQYEETTMQAYEKRAVTSQKTHQSELNNLNVELTNAQMKIAQLGKESDARVRELEAEIEHLNVECDTELEQKQGELDMIKYKLDEQVDMVQKLEREREQLCLQMNGISNKRRDELEELQSDLMERTAENTSLHRALQSLQMQVEHQVDSSKELERLRNRVKDLESRQGPTGTEKHMQQFHVEKLEGENRKLKDQIRNITMERRGLQEKLNNMVTGQSEDRSAQVLRERNEKLRREVDRLRTKLEIAEEAGITRISV